MAVIFRKQEIQVGDKTIVLEFKKIQDIFKFNTPPYIVVGVTTAGKTTLCMDILSKFSHECTNIYYVTATEESLKDDTISMIPRAYRRKPKYTVLYAIWQEIKAAYEATNVDPSKLANMLTTLCGRQDAADIIRRLEIERDKINREQKDYYKKFGLDDNTAIQYAKDDSKAFYIDTMIRLILDFSKTRGTRNFSDNEMLILSSFISKAPRVMLLLDDVSAELDGLKKSKKKVLYEGQQLAESDAYRSLLVDILTRGRHYGALICMFLHSIDLLQEKSYINNLIILNDASAQKVMNARTFPEEMRKTIGAVKGNVFNSNYPYHFLFLSGLSGEVCVGKADVHVNEELPLSSINKAFVKVFEEIYAGTLNGTQTITVQDDYEYTSDENSGSGEDVEAILQSAL